MVYKKTALHYHLGALLLVVSVLFGSGCATLQRPSTKMLELVNSEQIISDRAIIRLSAATLEHYGMRALNAEILSTGGDITLFTLSTATVAMAAAGANPMATMATASVGNWLLRMLGIVKPDQRDAAFQEGSEDILRAIGEYAETLANGGTFVIPSDRMTREGGLLMKKTLAAIIAVNRQMVGLRPKFVDMQTLREEIEATPAPKPTPKPAPKPEPTPAPDAPKTLIGPSAPAAPVVP